MYAGQRMSMPDVLEEILVKASQGDVRAFEAVYKETAGFVYNVALRVVNNREDAQEVTQEVFVMIYRKLKQFRFQSSLKTWMYRVTVNCALNFAGKASRTRGREIPYLDSDVGPVPGADASAPTPAGTSGDLVEELLEMISPKQRACVVLRGMEGLSYQEIARALNININTVRSRLKRAREKLLEIRKKAADECV